jgi:hypothetical protein
MKIVIDNRRRETYSDRLSIVGDNRPITTVMDLLDFVFLLKITYICILDFVFLFKISYTCI